MSKHEPSDETRVFPVTDSAGNDNWDAGCDCGWHSKGHDTEAQAEDAVRKHLEKAASTGGHWYTAPRVGKIPR